MIQIGIKVGELPGFVLALPQEGAERPALPCLPEASKNGVAEPRLSFMPSAVGSSLSKTLPRGRKPRRLPTIALGKGVMSKYDAEKMYGVRRDNGAMKLKYLNRKHYEVIARHLAGQSGEQIHIYMGLSITSISRILNDPLSQQLIKRVYKDRQAELDALAGEAVHAIRETLQNGSNSERLAAVDKYAKLKAVIAPDSNPMESAEDYARALIKNAQNVQVNINTRS